MTRWRGGGPGRRRTAVQASGSVQAETLIGLSVAVVDLDLLPVAGAPDVQAASGLHAGDGSVGVHVPLLFARASEAVDRRGRAVAGAGGVQAHAAVHGQLLAR